MPFPSLEAALLLSPAETSRLVATFAPSFPSLAERDALAQGAFEGALPPKLARALAQIARFATLLGRAALIEAALATGREEDAAAWLALSPADAAARVVVARATGSPRLRRALDRVLALAALRVERELPEHPTYLLAAAAPAAPAPRAATIARALRDALGRAARDVWTHAADDGSLRVAVLTSARAFDGVLVSPDGARVTLTLAARERLPLYTRALGLALRASFTLKPLHDLRAETLARVVLPPGVRGVHVVALRWRTPDGARVEIRASDVLALPDAAALAARGGYVDRATLRVDLGARTVDVFLQLPHRVEVLDPSCAEEVHGALAALGLFEPGALPDDARSLAPYEHPDWRWRAIVGDAAFDALVKEKRFARVEVAHVASEAMRMHGASYVVRPVPGDDGAEYALAEDRAYGARLVTRADRVAWRLDRDALAEAMRRDLGATAATGGAAIAVDGVIDLGFVALASGRLRIVYAMATPPRGWLATLRRACGIGVTPAVLAPKGHARDLDGVTCAELDVAEQLGAKRIGRALGRIAEAAGVAHEVEGWRTCEEDVVIDAANERVWIDGVLVALSDKPFRFLLFLARAARIVTSKEIGAQISASEYPEEAARRIKGELDKQVAESMKKAGVPWDVARLVVTEGKKGYRLGAAVRVLDSRSASGAAGS